MIKKLASLKDKIYGAKVEKKIEKVEEKKKKK